MDERARVTILDKRAEWLQAHEGRNITSQFGEDGLIQALFGKIGQRNLWCLEVGANDGLYLSNTKWMRDAGWRAVLIEAEQGHLAELVKQASAKVRVVQAKVCGVFGLDAVLADVTNRFNYNVPDDLDFGCIDIDGQDYHVWDGMGAYKPRVMLVEFQPLADPDFIPPLDGEGQAGLNAICELGRSKGYAPLLHTYCNVLFCRSDVWEGAR